MPSLNDFLKYKRIAILGFGKEGKSTLHYLLHHATTETIKIFDDKVAENMISSHPILPISQLIQQIHEVDIIIKSPGVPWLEPFRNSLSKITSQAELFLKFAKGLTIGITGSAGKSSTTLFTYDLLRLNHKKVFMGGNYGIPLLDFLEETSDESISVVEFSSYQLKNLFYSPSISLFLNFYPDHLDYHKTIEDYFLSKCHIYQHQKKTGLFITTEELHPQLDAIVGMTKVVSFENPQAEYYFHDLCFTVQNKGKISFQDFRPKGIGYRKNLCLSILACLQAGLSLAQIQSQISALQTPPHRLENIGSAQGVTFYNDSIATIPEATLHALESIQEADSLILGGYDRGLDQSKLIFRLQNSTRLKIIVCMGQTGEIIYRKLSAVLQDKIARTDSLQQAVQLVLDAPSVRCCLFSPGAPSFGLFQNFEERGNTLRKIINGYEGD